jgi:hypothetical protein
MSDGRSEMAEEEDALSDETGLEETSAEAMPVESDPE